MSSTFAVHGETGGAGMGVALRAEGRPDRGPLTLVGRSRSTPSRAARQAGAVIYRFPAGCTSEETRSTTSASRGLAPSHPTLTSGSAPVRVQSGLRDDVGQTGSGSAPQCRRARLREGVRGQGDEEERRWRSSAVPVSRARYFWRRVLVLSVVAACGAVLSSAVQRVIEASGAPVSRPGCTVAAVRQTSASISLASLQHPVGTVSQGTDAVGAARAGAPVGSSRVGLDVGSSGTSYCQQVYVVRPGDTIWGIAQRYAGSGDPRAVADEIQAQVGGTVIQPGQEIAVP